MYRRLDQAIARLQAMSALETVYRQQKLRFLRDVLSCLERGMSPINALATARVAEGVTELRYELIDRWLDPTDPRCLTDGPTLADAYRYRRATIGQNR
jgi:hypothetical protein